MSEHPVRVSAAERGDGRPYPQAGRTRLIAPPAIAQLGTGSSISPRELLTELDEGHVFMMGDNPRLERMPAEPTLLDVFGLRVDAFDRHHMLQSAHLALADGQPETVVTACLLHDIAVGALIRADHGYWGAQLVEPYVSEEVAWAIRYHQALRYFPDEAAGYSYPDAYDRYFGPDFEPPDHLRRDAEAARAHRWYGTARAITIYDVYSFDDTGTTVDLHEFTDIVGRNFRQPREGLGFDGSPTAHMWRTIFWPNNFL